MENQLHFDHKITLHPQPTRSDRRCLHPLRFSLSRSLFPSISHSFFPLSLSLWINDVFVLIFVSCVVYRFWFSVIIFVWILRKCEKHDKNGFSRAFSATQPNTRKYFPKHFLECNQTLENIFLSRKYFHLKIFYTRKIFYIQPNTALSWNDYRPTKTIEKLSTNSLKIERQLPKSAKYYKP